MSSLESSVCPAINLDKAYEPCYSGGHTEIESKAGMNDNASSKSSAKGEELALPPGDVVSLNSRRLSAANMRRIAAMLGLLTDASMEERRQFIEGKLLEADREPRNVQVVIHEVKSTTETRLHLSLIDEMGVFQNTEMVVHRVTVAKLAEKIDRLEETKPRQERALQTVQWQQQQEESGQQDEIGQLRFELEAEKKKSTRFWALACQRGEENERLAAEKEAEVASLIWQLEECKVLGVPTALESLPRDSSESPMQVSAGVEKKRKGKAPPVDWFTGENMEVRVDDWLPALERATVWNAWKEEEQLIQLAGHLRGKALQEWNLLSKEDKATWQVAVSALKGRLDPGNKILAAQDFRHAVQGKRSPLPILFGNWREPFI